MSDGQTENISTSVPMPPQSPPVLRGKTPRPNPWCPIIRTTDGRHVPLLEAAYCGYETRRTP